jgi:ATP-dependent DNA helicase RecG
MYARRCFASTAIKYAVKRPYMAIQSLRVTADQARKILAIRENQFADLKAKEIAPNKLSKHFSAFANAEGGELYIGVNEDRSSGIRTWAGFENEEAANGHLQAFETSFPLGQEFSYEFLQSATCSGLLLKAEINKTRDIKPASDGKVYVRRGASSLPVETEEALQRLRLNKGLATFENETVTAELATVLNSVPILKFLLEVIPTAEPDAWLRKQQLIYNGKPTVAAILLFAEEPQAFLPKRCGIKIYRYKSKEKEGTRETLDFNPITIDGCIYEQIRIAEEKVSDIIGGLQVLTAGQFAQTIYPRETLHEILSNAVLHRDYSIPDDVHVRIFDNRVEIESPGTLPGHITVENILNERFSRNPSIVRLINKFPDPPNMDVGEGLNTDFAAMKNLRLKEPQIIQKENSVLVNIRHEPLGSPEEIIMRFLDDNEAINNSVARQICHIGSENTVKRIFQRLIKEEQIEPIPELRGSKTAYRRRTETQRPSAKNSLFDDPEDDDLDGGCIAGKPVPL